MKTIEINLESDCNLDCVFCKRHSYVTQNKVKSPTLEDIKKIVNEQRPDALVFIGGGEPTMRDDLADLIRIAKKMGVADICVETNGYKLKDLEYMRLLKNAGLTSLIISVYSNKPDIFDKITQKQGSFEAIDSCLKNMVELGISIRNVLCTITSYNLRGLNQMIDYLAGAGIKQISFGFVRPIDASENSRKYTPRLSVAQKYIKAALIYSGSKNIFAWTSPGFMEPCFLQGLEEYSSIIRIASDEKIKEAIHYTDKVRVPACASCLLQSICLGPNKVYVDMYGDKEFKPVKRSLDEINKKYLERASRR